MRRTSIMIYLIMILAVSSLAEASDYRVSGSFGVSVYESMPKVSYSWDSGTSLPANYMMSASAQSKILPYDMFVLMLLDRTWSGNEEFFSNRATVATISIGRSFALGYAQVEPFLGISRYWETFKIESRVWGQAEAEDTRTGVMLGMNMVFPVFENVCAITSYRIMNRREGERGGSIELEPSYTIQTNNLDHMISFGLGYIFGE